jgi:hypothetical protein
VVVCNPVLVVFALAVGCWLEEISSQHNVTNTTTSTLTHAQTHCERQSPPVLLLGLWWLSSGAASTPPGAVMPCQPRSSMPPQLAAAQQAPP